MVQPHPSLDRERLSTHQVLSLPELRQTLLPRWMYNPRQYRNNAAFAGFIHGGVSERRLQRCSRQSLSSGSSWAPPIGTRRRFLLWR